MSIPYKCAKRSIASNYARRLPITRCTLNNRALRTSAAALGNAPKQPTVDHGYLPNSSSPITTNLEFFDAVTDKAIPAYRVLDGNGEVLDGATLPEVCFVTYRDFCV